MKINDILLVEDHAEDEMRRLADHWKKEGKGMSKDQLADAIGQDLEMLEYSPEEVDKMVPRVLKMIGV